MKILSGNWKTEQGVAVVFYDNDPPELIEYESLEEAKKGVEIKSATNYKTVVNLLPYTVFLKGSNDRVFRFPPFHHSAYHKDEVVIEKIFGNEVDVYKKSLNRNIIPPYQKNTIFIVRSMMAYAFRDRDDLYFTAGSEDIDTPPVYRDLLGRKIRITARLEQPLK